MPEEAPQKSSFLSTTEYYKLLQRNKKTLQFIEDVTANAAQVQRRVLAEILSRNAHVEYLRRHSLAGATDPKTFKNTIPVISYEDIQHDINRIANGDSSPILCSSPISEFLTRWVSLIFLTLFSSQLFLKWVALVFRQTRNHFS